MNLVREFKGREFGFVIWKDCNSNRVWMSDPAGGELAGEVDMGLQHRELARLLEQRDTGETALRLSKLHFHGIRGREADIIVPSGSQRDLGTAAGDREWNQSRWGVDMPTIEIVGLVDQDEANLLLFQEPMDYRPMEQRAIRRELDLTLNELADSQAATQQDVIAALQHYRYRVMLLNTVNRKLVEEDLTKLAEEFSSQLDD